MEKSAKAHLFVYGTLRKGFESHELLRTLHAQFLAKGHIQGKLYDLGDYPGALESASGARRIVGEIYLLPNASHALLVLDRFEGFVPENPRSSLFERKITTVTLDDGEQMQVWIYWLRNSHRSLRPLPSGDYAMNRG